MEYQDGIYPDMPEAEYHAIERMSKSQLATYIESPRYFRLQREGSPYCQRKESDSMRLGSQFDDAISLPAFDYAIKYDPADLPVWPDRFLRPSGGLSTAKAVVEEREAWLAEQGLTADDIFTEEDRRKAADRLAYVAFLRDLFMEHPDVARLESGITHRQVSLLWTDRDTGVRMKSRLDGFGELGGVPFIVDDKTTSAPIKRFIGEATRWRYDLQHAIYQEAAVATGLTRNPPAFVFRIQQTTRPYETATVDLPDMMVIYARRDYHEGLRRFAADDFGLAYVDRQAPDMPAWMLYEREGED